MATFVITGREVGKPAVIPDDPVKDTDKIGDTITITLAGDDATAAENAGILIQTS